MNQKNYLVILKVGIILSFLSVFLVYSQFLFPYITSKQIYFNVITEVLLVFWLAFIVKYPQWRPKKSMITTSLVAFLGVMLFSCFYSVDFNLSFWGDIERMLGFFHIVHFLILYLVSITVLRNWNDWKIVLSSFVVVTAIVSLTGLYGANKYGTIGNAAYVGGMIIFGLYFSFLLMVREKNKYLRFIYLIPIFFMIDEFIKINIAGAFVGLGVSVLAFIFLFGLLHKNKKVKITFVTMFFVLTGSILFVITHKDMKFVKNIRQIQDLSFQERTLQTRFFSWRSAMYDFPNHWLLGTGYGTFASTFDEYFDPRFYNLTRSGTYFDRAHNNIIDIISTTGVLGGVTYLSMFVAILWYLLQAYKKKRLRMIEFVLLLCLIIAYFIQNLAVFDSLVTYIGLMLMLGFIYYITNSTTDTNNTQNLFSQNKKLTNNEIYVLFGFGFLILIVIYQYNLAPANMLRSTIQAQAAFSNNDILRAKQISEKTVKTPLNRDSRSAFIRGFLSHSNGLRNLTKDEKIKTLKYVISLSRENVALDPNDSLMQMRLAQILNFASRSVVDDKELFNKWHREAMEAINKSIESSPGRIPTYSVKALIQLTGRDINGAIDTLKYAISINRIYEKSYCQLAEIYILTKNEKDGYKELEKCVELDGIGNIRNEDVLKLAVNHYNNNGNNVMMLDMYKQLALITRNDSEIWVKLAKLYFNEKMYTEAKKSAQKALQIDPKLQNDVNSFIEEIDKINK